MYILLGIIALLVIGFVIWIVYQCIITIYRKTALRYETTSDVAKVVGKDYNDNLALRIATRNWALYDEYNVYILYKGEKYCFNDEDLYEKVEVGDTVRVLIHKGFDKYGELKHTYLSIED